MSSQGLYLRFEVFPIEFRDREHNSGELRCPAPPRAAGLRRDRRPQQPAAVGSQISGTDLSTLAWPCADIHDRPFEN
jgi:hypothetical protein